MMGQSCILRWFSSAKDTSSELNPDLQPVWDAMKTRKEARMAAALCSSLALAIEFTRAGGGARFRTAGGDRVMR